MEAKIGSETTTDLSATNDNQAQTLDLSKKGLKKVPKQDDAQNIKILILDDNDLQKIDNIDSYLRIRKLSLCRNSLLRMYGVCRLHFLQELILTDNGILTIEGLKELTQLKHLNLQGNSIKTIEHLNSNYQLEYLNLGGNSIGSITDISFLKNLRELHLNGNRISHLRQCDRYLPVGLQVLTLAHNILTDLNEICTLSGLSSLNSISIQENPCVQMTGNSVGFDYRPFVLNWCMTVKVIDGFVVNPIESLKAEWLYSQGRGRQFRVGEQVELARYLSSVCPMTGETLENEDERKLRLILSKAQQHQRQLQEEISEGSNLSATNSPSSNRRKGTGNRIQSPRVSRLGRSGSGSPDSMSSSYHGNTSTTSSMHNDVNPLIQMSASLIENVNSDQSIMVQSLDPTILSNNTSMKSNSSLSETTCVRSVIPQLNDHQIKQSSPLMAASKMVPVPESLMSPDCPPPAGVTPGHPKVASSTSTPNNRLLSKPSKESKLTSPKISRSTATSAVAAAVTAKRQEKSPVLNVRKNNTINAALRASQNHVELANATTSKHPKHLPPIHRSSPPPPQPQSQPVQHTPPPVDDSNMASSDDDSDHINVDKLKTIHNKVAQKSQQYHHKEKLDSTDGSNDINAESSATMIQKMWRGYKIRKDNKGIAETLQKKRTQEYILKLTHDMETTKVALENERKIQQLQMQAINALWKKVSTMQSTSNNSTADLVQTAQNFTGIENNSTAVVQDLAKTCSVLTNQVQQLQGSMRDILHCMTVFCKLPPQSMTDSSSSATTSTDVKDSSATQTEIVAVHTPQVENLPFPFINKVTRPSTLPLVESNEASPRKVSAENVSSNKDQSPENDQKDAMDENITINCK